MSEAVKEKLRAAARKRAEEMRGRTKLSTYNPTGFAVVLDAYLERGTEHGAPFEVAARQCGVLPLRPDETRYYFDGGVVWSGSGFYREASETVLRCELRDIPFEHMRGVDRATNGVRPAGDQVRWVRLNRVSRPLIALMVPALLGGVRWVWHRSYAGPNIPSEAAWRITPLFSAPEVAVLLQMLFPSPLVTCQQAGTEQQFGIDRAHDRTTYFRNLRAHVVGYTPNEAEAALLRNGGPPSEGLILAAWPELA